MLLFSANVVIFVLMLLFCAKVVIWC